MGHIDYFFAPSSSHTYLAGLRLEQIAERHAMTVTYKPLDLVALFGRTGGIVPRERHPSRQEYRLQDLARQAKKQGLVMNMGAPFVFTNQAPASYAIIAAQTAGGGNLAELVHSFPRAAWVDGLDVAEDAVIRELLEKSGFEPGLVDSGMLAGAEAYGANLEEAAKRGVFGAPFYITDTDERFWGQDRLYDLDLHLAGKI